MKLLFGARVVLPLAVVAGILYFYAPARLAALVVIGRSPVCPFTKAIASAEHLKRLTQAKDRILAASRKLDQDDRYELWNTPSGRFWIPRGSHYVLPFNLAEQERRIYSSPSVSIRRGDTVLDCGANVGVYTRVALEEGAALVVAIEPAPENVEVLRRNFADEIAAGRVVVYPKGVWDRDDALTLHVDPHNSAADSFVIRTEGSHEVIQVPVTTIDSLVAELNLGRVDFIKMDIEGAEVKALEGGRATIAKHRPRMAISAYHDRSHPVEIPRAAHAAWPGYRMECGPCAEAGWSVRPDVLLFY
jgi:FkbM family methyltransferase